MADADSGPTPVPTTDGMLEAGWWSATPLADLRRWIGPGTRVAVVGSSGNLLGSWKGAEIDGHHVVIRMNGPVLQGHEQHVGRLTHIRVAWETGLEDARTRGVVGGGELIVYGTVRFLRKRDCA